MICPVYDNSKSVSKLLIFNCLRLNLRAFVKMLPFLLSLGVFCATSKTGVCSFDFPYLFTPTNVHKRSKQRATSKTGALNLTKIKINKNMYVKFCHFKA